MKKFVAIGHVDTGKSCLCGHLLYKCGYVDEREMEKIRETAKKDKMEKWVWSRVLDIYEEEMLKGKTHEFMTVTFEHQGKEYELIDTPGHKAFIQSMIDGISENVNIAVLLLSMQDNEFDASFGKGTLKEHLLLARAMGIEHLIIAANKMDLIDWDEKIYQTKVNKVMKYLKTLRWDNNNVKCIPISAFNGIGLVDKEGLPEWYKGESLVDLLDSIDNSERKINKNPLIETERFVAKIVITNDDILVTRGYTCLMHWDNSNIADIYIDKIKNKHFIKKGEIADCMIKLDHKMELKNDMRIILREKGLTIGFGKIIKLK